MLASPVCRVGISSLSTRPLVDFELSRLRLVSKFLRMCAQNGMTGWKLGVARTILLLIILVVGGLFYRNEGFNVGFR